MKRIWQKIIHCESYRYYKAHGDTVVLKLECGHEVSRKASQGMPSRHKVVCRQCEMGG